MYKDLITQIAKYLLPNEKYYLSLEIRRMPIDEYYHDAYFTTYYMNYCFLFLIYEVDGEIKMKYKIKCISSFVDDCDDNNIFRIEDLIIDDNLIIATSDRKYKGCFCPPYIRISNKNLKLNVIKAGSYLPSEISGVRKEIEKKIHDLGNYDKVVSNIDLCKINKKSLIAIREGIEIFKRISKITNIKDMNLTENEKKYVKIYYQ